MPLQKRGFTLIELLVVIAIIAILAAILFPIFLGAKKHAQTSQCLSNLRQLSQAFRMYADDHQGVLPWDWPPATPWPYPTGTIPNWCGSIDAGAWVYPERGLLWPYVRNAKVYRCPSDITRAAVKIDHNIPIGFTNKDYPLSYSVNHYLAPGVTSPKGWRMGKLDTILVQSKMMLLLHENRGEKTSEMAINDGTFVPGGQDVPGNVHYDGTTLSYLDMHAGWKPRIKLLAEVKYWIP